MRTTKYEPSEETKEATGVSVIDLRSPTIGDVDSLPIGLFSPDYADRIRVSDMLKVIEPCLDSTVSIEVVKKFPAHEIQDLYQEAVRFFLPSGEPKVTRNWKTWAEKVAEAEAAKAKASSSANS